MARQLIALAPTPRFSNSTASSNLNGKRNPMQDGVPCTAKHVDERVCADGELARKGGDHSRIQRALGLAVSGRGLEPFLNALHASPEGRRGPADVRGLAPTPSGPILGGPFFDGDRVFRTSHFGGESGSHDALRADAFAEQRCR